MINNEKDFNGWNNRKIQTHNVEPNKFYHQREIWWCALGVNIGFEQDGTGDNFDRPVLVIKGFNRETFFGVALIGRKKVGRYYFYIGEIEKCDATVTLSQVRLVDTKRLVRKMVTLDEKVFEEVREALKKTLFS